ncbi:hypothetical protein CIK06_21235 [Plantactinospora sp. KBS50]|nr:hypothetical protein CIK06_21235 [Plantactinospora sp. KBS50]
MWSTPPGPAPGAVPPRRPSSRILLGIVAAALGLCCIGGIVAVSNDDDTPAPGSVLSGRSDGVDQLGAGTPSAVPTSASAEPSPSESSEPAPSATVSPTPAAKKSVRPVYYANCAAVRAAGKAPLRRGRPGYRAGLDRDGDGVACESSGSSGSTSTGGGSTGSGTGTGSGSSVYYANCAAVRAAGKAPLHRGQPGYRAGLDRDGDGVACE